MPAEASRTPRTRPTLSGWESQNTLDIYLAIVAGLVLVGARA